MKEVFSSRKINKFQTENTTKRFTIKVSSLVLTIYIFIVLFLDNLVPNSTIMIHVMGISSLVLLIWLMNNFKENTSLFITIFFIWYSVYSIYVVVYLTPEILPGFFSQFKEPVIYYKGLECIFLFVTSLIILVSNNKNLCNRNKNINCIVYKHYKDNYLISCVCILAIVYILITGIKFNLSNGRAEASTLFEYKIIFFIVGMIYTKNSKTWKYIWLILIIIASMMSFIGGNRADAIPMFIAYVFFYHNNMNYKKICVGLVAAIFFMIAIGTFRESIIYGKFDFDTLSEKIMSEKLTFDTAYWAYIPTLASIDVKDKIPTSEKIELLKKQVSYIIFGGEYEKYKIEFYVRKYYEHVNGFVSPAYFYFWFGYIGVLMFSFLVFFYINKIYIVKSNSKKKTKIILHEAMVAYFVSSVPRWFLYDPYSLIRGEMILSIVTLMAIAVDKICSSGLQSKGENNYE